MEQSVVRLLNGSVVCAIPDCATQLCFNVTFVLKHFRVLHPTLAAVNRSDLSSDLQRLALQLFVHEHGNIRCISCSATVLASTAASLQLHLRAFHNLRNVPAELLASICDQQPVVSPTSPQQQSHSDQRELALFCADATCDYAVSLSSHTQAEARRLLHQHLKHHGASYFDETMNLLQRAQAAQTGFAVKRGKRCRKDPSTNVLPAATSTASSPITTTTTVTTLALPSTSTPRSTSSPAPFSTKRSEQSLSVASSAHVTVPYYSSTGNVMKDEALTATLTGRYSIVNLHPVLTASLSSLKLCDEAIKSASPIYKSIEWWVDDQWYTTICTEGALAWYSWVQPCPDGHGAASMETLHRISLGLIDVAIDCAIVGRMIHPGIAGGLSTTSSFTDDRDDVAARLPSRYGLSVLQNASRHRYAAELVKVLLYFNNVCISKHGVPLIGSSFDSMETSIARGYLFQMLFDLEWPEGNHPAKLGTIAQAVAASCLVDSRLPGENSEPLTLKDLRLVPASRLAATCSAMVYVLKCIIVINRRHSTIKNRPTFFDTSRSGSQLAAIKLNYDHMPETEHAFQKAMLFDFVESAKRNTPVYWFCPSGFGGEGASHIGVLEISAAVTQATTHCSRLLKEMLETLSVSPGIVDLLTLAHSNLLFHTNQTVGHFHSDMTSLPLSEEELQELSADDIGIFVTAKAEKYKDDHSATTTQHAQLIKLLKDFESHLVFLVHLSSGGPGRAQDVFDLMLGHTSTSGRIEHLTNIAMRIESIVHKRPDHQHVERNVISRFPTYSTCKLVSVYVSIVRGLFPNHQRLWSPLLKDKEDLIDAFNRAAASSFRVPMQFNAWRHLSQLLISKGDEHIRRIGNEIAWPGSKDLDAIVNEGQINSGEPSITNVLTQQLGHSTTTAIRSYATRDVAMEKWRQSSRTMQTFLELPGIDPVSTKSLPSDSGANDDFPSLFPSYAVSRDEQLSFVATMLSKAFEGLGPRREPTTMQLDLSFACLNGRSDVIVVGGCGTGKSAAYLVTGWAAMQKRSAVLLLCPQNNVAMCAEHTCHGSNLPCMRVQEDQESHDYVSMLLATSGQGLNVGVFIVTFETIAQSPTFKFLIKALRQYNLLSRVIVDEVHICLSSYYWRMCFNTCGNLPHKIGYNIPWIFTTATLPDAAMQPYQRFWHLGTRPVLCLRSKVDIPSHIYVSVETVTPRDNSQKKLEDILKAWFSASTENWRADRVMVLCVSKAEATKTAQRLLQHKPTFGIEDGDAVAVITAESTNEQTTAAIHGAKVIVCTTVLASSVNIPRLNGIIVYKTTYSMADLVQAFGRVGRDGSASRAVLLWSASSHGNFFPPEDHEPEMTCLAWANGSTRLHSKLRPTFAPSGVLAFAQSNECRRVHIANMFNAAGTNNSGTACGLLFEGVKIDYNESFCDRCLFDAQRSLMGDFDQEPIKEEEQSSIPNTQEEPLQTSEPKEGDWHPSDDDDVEFILRAERATPGDDCSAMIGEIFRQLHEILQTKAPLDTVESPPCFLCGSRSCQGIRDEHSQKPCPGRQKLSKYNQRIVCYGCGGSHFRKDCLFWVKGEQPKVVTSLHRCYDCYLPQHAMGTVSFHSNDDHRSGNSRLCRARGKNIFGVLTCAINCRDDILKAFSDAHVTHVSSLPPQYSDDKNHNGARFNEYWTWLFQISSLREDLLNVDVWLLYLLEECLDH